MRAHEKAEERAWDALAEWIDEAPRWALEALAMGGASSSILPPEVHALVSPLGLDVAGVARMQLQRWSLNYLASQVSPVGAEALVWCSTRPLAECAD